MTATRCAAAPTTCTQDTSALRADLATIEARLDELKAERLDADRDGVRLTFSGRVNQVFLFASQGDQDQSFIVDTNASGSRIGFLAETGFGDLTTGVEVEFRVSTQNDDESLDDDNEDHNVFTGSASVLAPFGLNGTLAGSVGEFDGQDVDNPFAVFAKVGYRTDMIGLGETRFSLDFFLGANEPDFASPDGDLPQGDLVGPLRRPGDLGTQGRGLCRRAALPARRRVRRGHRDGCRRHDGRHLRSPHPLLTGPGLRRAAARRSPPQPSAASRIASSSSHSSSAAASASCRATRAAVAFSNFAGSRA